MRLGLIGTGYWATVVHAAGAAGLEAVDLVGVWGRNRSAAKQIATEFGIVAYDDADALIEDVDALMFAVPPAVQVEIAIRAAQRGRHLLLEKPVSLDPTTARTLERTVDESHVAALVFFTQRFVPATQQWLEGAAESSGWVGGRVETLSNIYAANSPFAASVWRREYGALWDIGPHALSLLWPVLGPVTAVAAGGGVGDHVDLLLRHAGGASSTVSLALTAPVGTAGRTVYFDGESGRLMLPPGSLQTDEIVKTHQRALQTLVDLAGRDDRSHACDVHFGARVVEVLAAAAESLKNGCWVQV